MNTDLHINREDMMELTRRMTVKRTSFTRIAGAYIDADGEIDGTFNTSFLSLTPAERAKNIEIAKAIPFSETNRELKRHRFKESSRPGSMGQFLSAMKSCGLKNDALMETFYEVFAERYESEHDYAVFVFHDRYDIPSKASDHERLWESENIFEYIICAVCPLAGDYEPGTPRCGFIYPAFSDGGAALNLIDIFQKGSLKPRRELAELLDAAR